MLAPSASAVEVLKSEGFACAETLQQLLENQELRRQVQGRILWIDEAGFLSLKQMNG